MRDTTFTLHNITIGGSASPDGLYKTNMELARRRMLALCSYITQNFTLPEGVAVRAGECRVCWPEFREAVAASSMADADRIIQISSVGNDDNDADSDTRLRKLRQLDGGRIWSRLASEILPGLRNAMGITISTDRSPSQPKPETEHASETATESATDSGPAPEPEEAPASESWRCLAHNWHLGTNAVEWVLAIANLTGEYDFARRWSAALSLHYSGWNYGKSTRKFRTFIFRPEVRFWLSDCHKGFFINAHLQMAAYNFAMTDWRYRIQDVDGKNPALGGGVGFGYRIHLDKKRHWSFQADLGAGVYHLHYDRFDNRSNGRRIDSRKRTWAGIDHFGLSVIYNFKSDMR